MGSDPHSAYKSTQIETASQEQILLMLYDGAIKFSRQAREALESDQTQVSHDKLIRAQDIVTELMSSLDTDIGGEVAEELMSLYEFVRHNLIQANVHKDPSYIEEALPVLEELHETWDEVINEKGITVEKARAEVMDSSADEQPASSSPDQESSDQSSSSAESTNSSSPGTGQDVTYGDLSIQG